MSAGDFVYSRYESNAGDIYRIRVQPETIALDIDGTVNTPPAGAINTPGTVRVNQSSRAFGVKARSISIAWSGAPPAGYSGDPISRIPVLQATLFDGTNLGDGVTYLGAAGEVVGKSSESVR